MEDSQVIAKIIKETAIARNVPVGKMLEECGISKNALSSMNQGYYPRIEYLVKIADYLNVSVDFLLGRNKSTPDDEVQSACDSQEVGGFYDRFISLCQRNGKKPNPVAAEIGFSSAMVTKYKNGAMPSGDILARIADYFDVSVDFLLGRQSLPVKTESEWFDILSSLSPEALIQLREYTQFLLWRQGRVSEDSQ